MELPTKVTDRLQDFFSRPSSETHINILNGSFKKEKREKENKYTSTDRQPECHKANGESHVHLQDS